MCVCVNRKACVLQGCLLLSPGPLSCFIKIWNFYPFSPAESQLLESREENQGAPRDAG